MSNEAIVKWNTWLILISFAVAFIGAYCAVTLCEQFRSRSQLNMKHTNATLWCMAIALGLCCIWSMHFVGMGARILYTQDGQQIKVYYGLGMTFLSLIIAVSFVYIGLRISTRDRIYSKDRSEIFQLIINDAQNASIQNIRSKTYLLRIALFKGIWPLLIGGVVTGGGVCVMHYLGMEAIEAKVHTSWDPCVVAASVIIAIVAATAAFWILFRLLSLYPEVELLRIVSAVAMTIAVCGMHYTGMAAATYEYDPRTYKHLPNTIHISREESVFIALAAGLGFSWLMTMITQTDLRVRHVRTAVFINRVDEILRSARGIPGITSTFTKYEALKREANDDINVNSSVKVFPLSDHVDSNTELFSPSHMQRLHREKNTASPVLPYFDLPESISDKEVSHV